MASLYVYDYQDQFDGWFFTGLSRGDIDKMLYKKVNQQGSFAVRPSDTYLGDFSLSVKDGKRICHYLIRRLCSGHFLISVRVTFPSLLSLVTYYVDDNNGLKPCVDSSGKERIKRQVSQFKNNDVDDDLTINDLLFQPYYYGEMKRADAEKLLLSESVDGCNLFLIRKSESYKGEFALSVKENDDILHFRLPELQQDSLIIARKYIEFISLDDLVQYFSLNSNGLCAKLTKPGVSD
ncbi:uncharacterized protein TRIADDRAFT_52520 [Trichoplax adhaerens]|uniref:SH2 domain-containing protein n=1 Tax=Trichoplax adhaerens TaxID=10228 RepID=B3RJ03_TRIAD|nr:hypothetical protein TRIADDRAFT_52520 [Trichoplax adhaerens]EDV29778.1 hypothetical protein TRIADDRAFT_52520 [Trichoplax adhaerens]|eukprot:XP_002108980.1 hypothetical protein TRIADDRAFT_52520 [Trichoplax adhaerens]